MHTDDIVAEQNRIHLMEELTKCMYLLGDARKELEKAKILCGCLTIGNVINNHKAIEVLGLNPWCVNEGLADSHDDANVDLSDIQSVIDRINAFFSK